MKEFETGAGALIVVQGRIAILPLDDDMLATALQRPPNGGPYLTGVACVGERELDRMLDPTTFLDAFGLS